MSEKVISFEEHVDAIEKRDKMHNKDKVAILWVTSAIAVCWMITAIYAFGTIRTMTKVYFETPYSYGDINNTNTNTLTNGVDE